MFGDFLRECGRQWSSGYAWTEWDDIKKKWLDYWQQCTTVGAVTRRSIPLPSDLYDTLEEMYFKSHMIVQPVRCVGSMAIVVISRHQSELMRNNIITKELEP